MLTMKLHAVVVIVALGLAPLVTCRMEESFVRVEPDKDGSKYVILMDFTRVVFFYFDKDGEILDCRVLKMNDKARESIYMDSETMLGDPTIQYVDQEIDVAWYGRQCSKFIRGIHRYNNSSDPKAAAVMDRQTFYKGWPGTKFCSSGQISFNSKLHFDDLSQTDQCCQDLVNCGTTISQFAYQDGFLNGYPYRIFECKCLSKFKTCLQRIPDSDEEAQVIRRLYFDLLQVKCIVKKTYTLCEEYDKWFQNCVNGTEVTYFTIGDK